MQSYTDKIKTMLKKYELNNLIRLHETYEVSVPHFDKLPASTRYHHSWEGGYLQHVFEVMTYAEQFAPDDADFDLPQLIFLAYIHDLDKVYRYKYDTDPPSDKQISYARSLGCGIKPQYSKSVVSTMIDNAKNNTNKPIRPFTFVDKPRCDESAKVVQLLMLESICLSDEELHALAAHHGGWNNAGINAGDMTETACLLHCADLVSTVTGKPPI